MIQWSWLPAKFKFKFLIQNGERVVVEKIRKVLWLVVVVVIVVVPR